MMKIIPIGLIFVSMIAPAFAADAPFLTVTITDIGRPYKVLDGGCATGEVPGFHADTQTIFQLAAGVAGNNLVKQAKAHGADAIVGMTVMPIPEQPKPNCGACTFGEHSAVMICGTFVKFQ